MKRNKVSREMERGWGSVGKKRKGYLIFMSGGHGGEMENHFSILGFEDLLSMM